MRSEGGSKMGEEETTVVASERRIMLSGKTESGALFASMVGGATGGMDPGRSATVDVRFSEECMLRCCFRELRLTELCVVRSRDDDEHDDANEEVRR